MRGTKDLVAVLAAGAVLLFAAPVRSADEICAAGGALIHAEIDRDRALAWAKGERRADLANAEGADWSLLVLSRAEPDIVIYLAPGYVFFGVAGRGGELYPRDIERAFGKDLKKLREAVRKGLSDLWKAGAVKIAGADVQPLADGAGLGVLDKAGGGWTLSTRDCQAVDLPASGL